MHMCVCSCVSVRARVCVHVCVWIWACGRGVRTFAIRVRDLGSNLTMIDLRRRCLSAYMRTKRMAILTDDYQLYHCLIQNLVSELGYINFCLRCHKSEGLCLLTLSKLLTPPANALSPRNCKEGPLSMVTDYT